MSAIENRTFSFIIRMFEGLRVWPSEEEGELRKIAWKIFYFLGYALFQMFIIFAIFRSDNKDQSLFLLEVLCVCIVLDAGVMYLLWNKEDVLLFLNDSLNYSTENYKITLFMQFVNTYNTMVAVAALFVVLIPLFLTGKMLPTNVSYTFDGKYSEFIYWFLYIFLSWELFLSFLFNLLFTIIWYIMLKYSIRYEDLGNQFRNLGRDRIKGTPKPKNCFLKEFIGLVRNHRDTYEYIGDMFFEFLSVNFVCLPGK